MNYISNALLYKICLPIAFYNFAIMISKLILILFTVLFQQIL